eukprot:7455718-Heterocapsa_arctica.AAC.1
MSSSPDIIIRSSPYAHKSRVPASRVHTHVGTHSNVCEPLRAQHKSRVGNLATHVGNTHPGHPVQEPGAWPPSCRLGGGRH